MAMLAPVAAGASAISGLQIMASLVSIVGGLVGASMQASQLREQAQILEDEKKESRRVGQINQQEKDFEALTVIGQEQVRQAGSGLEFGSTNTRRRAKKMEILARRDALRIRHDAEREAISFQRQADAKRKEASMVMMGAFFNAIGGALDMGGSMVGGSTLVNRMQASSLTRTARGVPVL